MREIKIEYIFDDHNWWTFKEVFKIEDMEGTINVFDYYPVIARRQYIWLKDKNWKEIYEGDIIKADDKLFIIKYDEALACYYWEGCLWIYDIQAERREKEELDKLEVLWNIYENPKLITT